MMDLLIQVGTANKLNPGDHIVQVRNERGIELPYKPSTPIGTYFDSILLLSIVKMPVLCHGSLYGVNLFWNISI